MRSALALSALLLLWPPLPSLSQQGASTTTNPPDTTKSTTEQTPTGKVTDTTTTKQSTVIATTNQKTTSVQTSQSTTTTPNGQGSGPNTPVTASSTNAATTSSQDGKKATSTEPQTSRDVTTKTVTTLGGNPMNQTPSMVNISDTTPATTSSTSPGGTKQVTSGPTTQNPTGSTTEELNKTTTTSSNAYTLTGHTPTPQGASTILTTLATSPGSQQSPSKTPAVPGTSACKTPRPAVSSPEPTTTSSSAPLATAAPHGSSTPPLTPDLENSTVRCEPPETWNEKMLLLKNTSLCAGSRADDKLVTLLCQAVKASFNRSHDQCHIRLVPIPESQAVAIKEVTIQTNRLPKDLFDSLKVRWDDLKKLGVSDMRLGNEGPPKDTEDRFSMPLIITIVCMASFLLLVAALYGCCHQRLAQRKDQQRLTEELQTVENGYHDNPTLEVMETSSEMQEKKVVNLNGELGDSWIVPLDNLIKDDLDEEEDTHL